MVFLVQQSKRFFYFLRHKNFSNAKLNTAQKKMRTGLKKNLKLSHVHTHKCFEVLTGADITNTR